MSGNRNLFHKLSCLILGLIWMTAVSMTAVASENATSSKEYLDTLNVGVTATMATAADAARDTAGTTTADAATDTAGTTTADAAADTAEITGNDSMAVDENATSSKEYLDTLSAGVSAMLAPDIVKETSVGQYLAGLTVGKSVDSGTFRGTGKTGADKEEEKKESDLVMADVQNALNVRAEANEEAEKVGL